MTLFANKESEAIYTGIFVSPRRAVSLEMPSLHHTCQLSFDNALETVGVRSSDVVLHQSEMVANMSIHCPAVLLSLFVCFPWIEKFFAELKHPTEYFVPTELIDFCMVRNQQTLNRCTIEKNEIVDYLGS